MGFGLINKEHLHHVNFHIHFPNLHLHHHDHDQDHEDLRDVPKGCFAVKVGHEEEEQQRFVIPLWYINHPLFMELLKEAEEESGFDHQGPITIPCHVDEFLDVQGLIDQDFHCRHVLCFGV